MYFCVERKGSHMSDNGTHISNFKRFLSENKTLAISVPVLIVLIVVVIIIYSGMGGEKVDKVVPALIENAPAEMTGNQVEVLPQTERDNGSASGSESGNASNAAGVSGETAGSEGSLKNPFSGPVKLTGILTKDNSNIAVLELGGKTVIVGEEDVLDNGLIVASITFDKVILKDTDKDIELSLE